MDEKTERMLDVAGMLAAGRKLKPGENLGDAAFEIALAALRATEAAEEARGEE